MRSEDARQRPQYLWPVLHVADVARHLGVPAISVLELGVAGGGGLVALEAAATASMRRIDVTVEVHGFDTGAGLPAPRDHRDAPYLMAAGDFAMDEPRLRERLSIAELHIGPVSRTVPAWLESGRPPAAMCAFDLDLYSSTVDALRLLAGPAERLMPRVLCYVDDTLGYPWGDSNGARRAILDFNAAQSHRVIDHLDRMTDLLPASQRGERWTEALYLAHVHDHPRYAEDEGVAITRTLDLPVGR